MKRLKSSVLGIVTGLAVGVLAGLGVNLMGGCATTGNSTGGSGGQMRPVDTALLIVGLDVIKLTEDGPTPAELADLQAHLDTLIELSDFDPAITDGLKTAAAFIVTALQDEEPLENIASAAADALQTLLEAELERVLAEQRALEVSR